MKSVFKISSLALVLTLAACAPLDEGNNNGAGQPQVFSLTECPVLAGSYVTGNISQVISENRTSTSYTLTLGEGAKELLIDGAAHSEGPVTYRGVCRAGVLELTLSAQGQKLLSRYYFSDQGLLVNENLQDGQLEKTVWVRR